jgi:nicotinamidase-related amidase
VRGITRLVVTGQHTDCCCRHASYDAFARRITVIAASDTTAVYETFTAGRYQQAQDDTLSYLRTYYGAEVTSTAVLV